MVQDVTSPPFMDVSLEPGFLLVKVLPPAPVKKAKKVIIKKDRGPRWVKNQLNSCSVGIKECMSSQLTFMSNQILPVYLDCVQICCGSLLST